MLADTFFSLFYWTSNNFFYVTFIYKLKRREHQVRNVNYNEDKIDKA